MKKHAALCIVVLAFSAFADEGMYPLSEIHKIDVASKGMMLSAADLYNPQGISLIQGICKLNGCTGSFVWDQGLIITNHHCAFDAIQSLSSQENDFLQNGFYAAELSQELPAKGYTARIIDSYWDVSGDVLSAVTDRMTFAERTRAIEKRSNQLVKEVEKKVPGKRAEIAEMFVGKTYVLFLYTHLRDIRLVYAPPQSIGNFGGEVDNWMWPRHTGDFSFLRAYVAPDGSPAAFSTDNVPYKPQRVLRVESKGVDEEDFVFVLGYPGRTFRHRTASYLAYEEEVRMPWVVDFYAWQIGLLESIAPKDRSVALKLTGRIKGLSNTMKNYRGKLLGLKRLKLRDHWTQKEQDLEGYIKSDPVRHETYGTVLDDIDRVYNEMRVKAGHELFLEYLTRSVKMVDFAFKLYEASVERVKKDDERKHPYTDRNFVKTQSDLLLDLQDYYEPSDRIVLKHLMMQAARLPIDQQIPAISKIVGQGDPEKAIDEFIEKAYKTSSLDDEILLKEGFIWSTQKLLKLKDPFIQFVADLYPVYQTWNHSKDARDGLLDPLYAKLVDVKKMFLKQEFIPDANGTLRLTYGRVRRYSPRDGVTFLPFTTVDGILEKVTGEEPFNPALGFQELIRKRDFGQFIHPSLQSVPTAILYNLDTTGGNSGSPVLNARGELVGVNFDRAYEATINDFAWSEAYSRSIGVDVRYVLWYLWKNNGQRLMHEMNVPVPVE